MFHNFLNLSKQVTAGPRKPPASIPLVKWSRPSTRSSQSRSTAWLFTWESPSPAQVAAISDCFIVHAEWPQAEHSGDWFQPALPRKPQSLCTQWTATHHVEALPPCPCTADPPQRVEVGVSGHSQSLQLTGLGKYLPLTCQQHQRTTTRRGRRVYSAHMKGTSRVSSLGDRGSCATGPCRTPTTLGYTTKTWNHSSST